MAELASSGGPRTSIPRLLVAGVSSGVGKTTVTVALVVALRARGLRVAVFKCGPDYLDPTYHRRAAGTESHNLDGWMMGREAVLDTFLSASQDADIAIIEGVMGLFDGASVTSSEGSSAEIARWLGAPVLLVLDASGMARSVAAVAHGFATFDPALRLAGLLCNRVGSDKHLALLREACTETPVLGGMVKDESAHFPSRHLGLHAADEAVSDADLRAWSERLLAHTALEPILQLAREAPPVERGSTTPDDPAQTTARAHVGLPRVAARRVRIGIARDEAFSFYYPYNLRLLERLGVELVPFSPIRDTRLPDVEGLYLGGGYPELHAEALSHNTGLRDALHAFVSQGRPLYAECGGLMFLSDAIVALDQTRYPMMGLVPGDAIMQPRLSALGYVEVETRSSSLLGPAGTHFRGHQFRYSRFETESAPSRYSVRTRRTGLLHEEGYGTGSIVASYVHAHWASNPDVARSFVGACAR